MEENGGWLKWVLIVPLCMAAGALMARLALPRAPRPAPSAANAAVSVPARPATPPAAAPAAGKDNFELQSDEVTQGEAGVVWTDKPGAAADRPKASAGTKDPPAAPAAAKKDTQTGFMYGALTKAAGKLLKDPKALAALFNNDFVVKGFMSRDTVKNATASKASLAAYLKDPSNLSKFMAKEPVQAGMHDQQLVNIMAQSKLVGAMLDTPGGKALMNDPSAVADVVKANPQLGTVLGDPALISALMSNPKTAGLVPQLTMAGSGK